MIKASRFLLVAAAACAKPQLAPVVPTPTPNGLPACDAPHLGELLPIAAAHDPIEQADLRLCVQTKSGKFFWIAPGTTITDDGVEL